MSTLATEETVRLEAEIDGHFTTLGLIIGTNPDSDAITSALNDCKESMINLMDNAGQEAI